MGTFYWLAVWFFMAMAFTGAWLFIVKGCEALDGGESDNDHAAKSGH